MFLIRIPACMLREERVSPVYIKLVTRMWIYFCVHLFSPAV